MHCLYCRGFVVQARDGWYCGFCDKLVEPVPDTPVAINIPALVASNVSARRTSPIRRVFGFVAMVIPLLFFVLPQASCVGNSDFTGLSLLQTLTGDGGMGESVGALVMLAVFVLAIACILAGIVGLVSLMSSSPVAVSAFSAVGVVGLVASGLGLLAQGDRSLQGLSVQLEAGFYLNLIAFLFLALAPKIEHTLGETPS